MSEYHIPVLLDESVTALIGPTDGVYADATFGGGGHSAEILRRLGLGGRLVGFDKDADAIANAFSDSRLTLVRSDYGFIANYIEYLSHKQTDSEVADTVSGNKDNLPSPLLDGVIADLGVSSHQFDSPDRGFSFRFDTPLDMRMNSEAEISAADVVNTYEEQDLLRILKDYGETDNPGRLAQLICKSRAVKQIATTGDLLRAVESALPKFAEHKVLAKIFQAIRIEVNGELKSLERFLGGVPKVLKPGGRLVVITYHSLEDRMVKNFIKTGTADGTGTKDIYGKTDCPFRSVNRKPTQPDEEEISANTRARSAKLRVAERI